MTDTIELHLANRIERLTPEERDEWARRAVKRWQGMESLWTAFARVLTGNRDVRVVMSSGPSRTDGTTIYYRPPLMLGDPSPHVRAQCDRRDADGHLICPACSSRESVERSITHEIAHIVGGSFQKSSATQQQRALRQAVQYAKNPIARAALEAGLRKVQWGDDVQTMMFKMSSFLGLIIMALEDARIDMQMFKARPGVRKMFESSQKRFSTTGQVDLSGELIQWSTRPLNAQIMIGLLWQAEGFGLGDLHEKVKHDLKDPALQDICMRVGRSGSALEIAALTIETLTRLWELGYCEPPEDMPEPPPFQPPAPPQPSQDEEPDDQDESDAEEQSGDDTGDSGDSDDDAGDEGSSEEDPSDTGADESDSGSGSPGEGDGGESAESPAGQPNGDDLEADSSGGEDLQEPGGDGSSGESHGEEAGDAGEPGGEPTEGSGDQDPDYGGSTSDAGDEQSGSGDSELDADSTGDQEQRGDADSDRSDDGGASGGGQSGEDEADGEATEGGSLDDPGDEQRGPGEDQSGSDGSSGSEPDVDPLDGEEGGEGEAGGSGTEAAEDDAAGVRDDGSGREDGSSESADDPTGGEDDGDSPAEGDRDFGKQGESGSDGTPGSEPGDRASEAEGDNGGEDPAGGGDSEGSADRSLDAGDTGSTAVDDGAGDPAGGLPIPDEEDGAQGEEASEPDAREAGAGEQDAADLPEHGAADDVADLIQDLTGHNHEDDETTPGVEAADVGEQAAIDKAIVQSKHFDAPSSTVTNLRVYEWPKDDEKCEAWKWGRAPEELTIRMGDRDRQGRDQWDTLRTPEEILQPALFEMRRILSDNQRSRDERNIKRGKLDGRALGKRAWKGDDDRLYKKRTRPRNRSYAVIIAGDCSWSQHLGKTMVVTKQAMFAQAELCHRMGIDFEVWAHTAEYDRETRRRYRQGEDVEPSFEMVMNQIKSWTDPWSHKQQEGLSWLHAVETNLDGHNLEFLRKRLMRSQATDKILLYYTDGEMPAANYDDELEVFKREIGIYQQMGIVLIGVGVGTDSPKRWGLPTVRVDKKGDVGKVIKHLEGEILRQRR